MADRTPRPENERIIAAWKAAERAISEAKRRRQPSADGAASAAAEKALAAQPERAPALPAAVGDAMATAASTACSIAALADELYERIGNDAPTVARVDAIKALAEKASRLLSTGGAA